MKEVDFSKNLIKGKVGEMIFEQMLRDAGGFTILGFGYEKILPELARQQHNIEAEETMEIIRRAPDFAVIKHDGNKVYLIEVKYMHSVREQYVLEAAEKMLASWNPSYLFIVSPHRFYFESAAAVVKKEGHIAPLHHKTISEKLQQQYLELLNQFISPNRSPG